MSLKFRFRPVIAALLLPLALTAALSAVSAATPGVAQAHQDGCHRWHSCPSDSGSYICGDLGYTSGCPGAQPTSSPTAPAAPTDKDCTDFASHGEAQGYFTSRGGPTADPDGLDVDRDGIACETLPGAPPQPACSNERDDDADGVADLADPECAGNAQGVSETARACNDRLDNDADRLVDGLDPTCLVAGTLSESAGIDAACTDARQMLPARQSAVRSLRANGYHRARSARQKRRWRSAQRRLAAARDRIADSCPEQD